LIRLNKFKDLDLGFVPPDLDFVPPGLDFVPKDFDFVPEDLDFLHQAGESALFRSLADANLPREPPPSPILRRAR
jgi:hypothetical protein